MVARQPHGLFPQQRIECRHFGHMDAQTLQVQPDGVAVAPLDGTCKRLFRLLLVEVADNTFKQGPGRLSDLVGR